MAGLLRAPAARTLVTRAAGAVRPARAPAHPRHRRRPAGHLPGASAPGSTRSTRPARRWPAPPRQPPMSALVAATDYTDRATGLVAAGGRGPGAVLGGGARAVLAVRVRSAVTDRPGLPARDPRRSAVEPAPAGHRARPRRPVRGGRGACTRPPTRMLGHLVKVTPSSKVVGDLALHLVGVAGRPRRVRGRSRPVRHPRLGDRVPPGELGDPPGGWPEPFRSKALGRPDASPRRPASCPTRTPRSSPPTRGRP